MVVLLALGVASLSDKVASLSVSGFGLVIGCSSFTVSGSVDVDVVMVAAVVSRTKAGVLVVSLISGATGAGEGVVALVGLRMSDGSEDSTNPNSSSSKRACRRFTRSAFSPSVERPLFMRASRSSETIKNCRVCVL